MARSVRPLLPSAAEFRKAHVVLFAAVAVPGLLLTATGIVSLALHRFTVDVVLGVLTLAFALWVVVGGLAVWLLVRRSEQLTRLQHDFVSNVSHELRTPLAGIRVLVETLRQERADAETRQRCLELLDSQSRRLVGLVEEVLEFGRLEGGPQPLTLVPVSLEEVVSDALREFESLRASRAISVEYQLAPGLAVMAERRALRRVLINLLENALKYSGSGQRLWVRGARQGEEVEIAVEDEGPGVPLPLRRKIFQAFYRGESEAVQSQPGTGLGLAIVQRLVVGLRGNVRVEGRPGGGSRFVVELPSAGEAA